MPESLTLDKLRLAAETECIRPLMYYDVKSELIFFRIAL